MTAYLPVVGSPAPNFPGLSEESNPYPKTSCTSWPVALPEATSDVAIRPSLVVAAPAMRVRRDRAVAIQASQDPVRLETVSGHGVWIPRAATRISELEQEFRDGGVYARVLLKATNLWKTRHQQCCRFLSTVAANQMARKRSMSVPRLFLVANVGKRVRCDGMRLLWAHWLFQLDSALKVSQRVSPRVCCLA